MIQAAVQAPPTLGSIPAACFALNARNQGKPRWGGGKRPSHAWNRLGYEPTGVRVPVPRDRMKEFRRIRSNRTKQVRKRRLVEVKRMITYRRTSADQTRTGA
ncbi:hypothetical protein ABGB12_02185 [Actinocorallia sp. B10E7]|uniref:hypothetical protein n=1 Tax=Actinocorallia sp. B10E7 TaxID=3153558 RepID=UPI00325EF5A0